MNAGIRFFEAIRTGNFLIFTNLLDADPRLIMARDENDWTPLHFVAALGSSTRAVHATMTKRLIGEGADVNCRTPLGWTPIHMVAMQGQKEAVDVASVLIAGGADLNAVDNQGNDWKDHWQHGKEIRNILEHAVAREPSRGTRIPADAETLTPVTPPRPERRGQMRKGERLLPILLMPFWIATSVAGPITYVLAVVDTWGGSHSVAVKLLVSLTVDVACAAVWPGTWAVWIVFNLMGLQTPIRLLVG
jgi:hypothetical protein